VKQIFIDTETTGPSPGLHEIIEIGWAVDGGEIRVARPKHTLNWADPAALKVNRYFERDFHLSLTKEDNPTALLVELIQELDGAELVAANPAFDAAFLADLIGFAPWHYRLFDIEVYARAVLRTAETPSLATIAKALRDLGYLVPEPDHTAASDVACLRECYGALHEINSRRW
jgi:DNA polymerase III subunit epsilon